MAETLKAAVTFIEQGRIFSLPLAAVTNYHSIKPSKCIISVEFFRHVIKNI